jgi:hypothetical protein
LSATKAATEHYKIIGLLISFRSNIDVCGIAIVPQFYLHLHECGHVTRDEEGFEFASLDDARDEAIRSARDIMCGTMHDGTLCLGCHIEVEDACGGTCFIVPFREAVRVSED